MKLIIAHIPNDAFDAVRAELLDLGVLRVTISEVHSSGPRSAKTLQYRGATLRTELQSELRLECVSGDGQSTAIVCVLRGHADQVGVIDLEQLHDSAEDQVFADDPRLDTALS
jgi:nitrogen regulatory protein PII